MAIIQPTTSTIDPEPETLDSFGTDDIDVSAAGADQYELQAPIYRAYEMLTYELDTGDTTPYISTHKASLVYAVCTAACNWEVPNADETLERQFDATGLAQNPSATKCGIIPGVLMPMKVRLISGSDSNTVTVYVIR